MNHKRIHSGKLPAARPLFLLFLLFLWLGSAALGHAVSDSVETGSAEATPDAQAEAKAVERMEADRAKFDALADSRTAKLREAAALEADAVEAHEHDAFALRRRALDLRLDANAALLDMGEVVAAMKSRNVDASTQAARIVALMPTFWESIESNFDHVLAERNRLVEERAGLSDPAEIETFGPKIDRRVEILVRILGLAVDGLDLSAELGIDDEVQREWVTDRLLTSARLIGSQLNLAHEELDDLSARADQGAEPEKLASLERVARQRTKTSSTSMRAVLVLMERLDLDTTTYHQLLVESTGELTVDVIDGDIVGEIIREWTAELRESIVTSGPSVAFAILLFLLVMTAAYLLARLVRRVVTRAVEARHLRFSELLKRTVISLSSGTIFAIGLLIALSQLGIEIAPMLAGLGIAGFVLGFALQDTLANFAAGLMVLLYRPYDVGDMIDCAGGVYGKVSHMSLVSTTILTIDNKTLIVPNNKIWGDVITNVTAQRMRRVDLEFGIGYGDDIPKAEEILLAVISEHPKVLDDPEPIVKLASLGDSSVNFVVRPWVATDDYWDVHWDVTREVKLRFDREGVSIPFPQRDVHLYPVEPADAPESRSGDEASEMEVSSTSPRAQDEPDSESS